VSGESGELYKAPPSPWRLMGRSQKNNRTSPETPNRQHGCRGSFGLAMGHVHLLPCWTDHRSCSFPVREPWRAVRHLTQTQLVAHHPPRRVWRIPPATHAKPAPPARDKTKVTRRRNANEGSKNTISGRRTYRFAARVPVARRGARREQSVGRASADMAAGRNERAHTHGGGARGEVRPRTRPEKRTKPSQRFSSFLTQTRGRRQTESRSRCGTFLQIKTWHRLFTSPHPSLKKKAYTHGQKCWQSELLSSSVPQAGARCMLWK